jgi:hypothetical protein
MAVVDILQRLAITAVAATDILGHNGVRLLKKLIPVANGAVHCVLHVASQFNGLIMLEPKLRFKRADVGTSRAIFHIWEIRQWN